jgi:hypothetical protein
VSYTGRSVAQQAHAQSSGIAWPCQDWAVHGAPCHFTSAVAAAAAAIEYNQCLPSTAFRVRAAALLFCLRSLPYAGAADDVSCRETPRLILQVQQPADQCERSFDGQNTRVVTNFTYEASMTGNGDSAPTFETFFDGESSSCEPEYVGVYIC